MNNFRRNILVFVAAFTFMVSVACGLYFNRGWFHAGDHIGLAQAVSGVLFGLSGSVFALAAVVAALRAADASEAQVVAARAQAQAALAQTQLAAAQLREAIRPILVIREVDPPLPDEPEPIIEIFNAGVGTACNISIFAVEPETGQTRSTFFGVVVPPQQVLKLAEGHNPGTFRTADPLVIHYESTTGHRYQSKLARMNEEAFFTYQDDPQADEPL